MKSSVGTCRQRPPRHWAPSLTRRKRIPLCLAVPSVSLCDPAVTPTLRSGTPSRSGPPRLLPATSTVSDTRSGRGPPGPHRQRAGARRPRQAGSIASSTVACSGSCSTASRSSCLAVTGMFPEWGALSLPAALGYAQKAATAASATAWSCAPIPPLTPTAPTTLPSCFNGIPPAKIITRP